MASKLISICLFLMLWACGYTDADFTGCYDEKNAGRPCKLPNGNEGVGGQPAASPASGPGQTTTGGVETTEVEGTTAETSTTTSGTKVPTVAFKSKTTITSPLKSDETGDNKLMAISYSSTNKKFYILKNKVMSTKTGDSYYPLVEFESLASPVFTQINFGGVKSGTPIIDVMSVTKIGQALVVSSTYNQGCCGGTIYTFDADGTNPSMIYSNQGFLGLFIFESSNSYKAFEVFPTFEPEEIKCFFPL